MKYTGLGTYCYNVHVGYRSKRTLRECWGQLERLTPRKAISNISLSWVKEIIDFSFSQRFKLLQ
jgi:hypothetical protein